MYRVWLMAAVLASVGCGVANAEMFEGEQSVSNGVVASRTTDGFRVLAAETEPNSLTAMLVAPPDVSAQTNTFTAADSEGKIDEAGRRSLKRHAPRFVHTTAFETPVPEPVALLLLGTALFGASGLCVYRAARMKRNAVAIAMS